MIAYLWSDKFIDICIFIFNVLQTILVNFLFTSAIMLTFPERYKSNKTLISFKCQLLKPKKKPNKTKTHKKKHRFVSQTFTKKAKCYVFVLFCLYVCLFVFFLENEQCKTLEFFSDIVFGPLSFFFFFFFFFAASWQFFSFFPSN